MFTTLLQVALGGAIGASARFLTNVGAARILGAGFPWGTVIVNVLGSFAMGVLVVALAQKDAMRLVPFLMTGILGGFTTFSAFSLDAMKLFQSGQPALSAVYVLGSVTLSLAAIVAGVAVAKGVLG
jgi:CrcB protein